MSSRRRSPWHARQDAASRPCVVNLSTLVIDDDAARADMTLALLELSGIPDADVAPDWSSAARLLAEREYQAVIAHEAGLAGAGDLLQRLDPASEHEPLALVLVTPGRHAEETPDLPGLGLVAEADMATDLIPRFQQVLAAAGIHCRLRAFCGKAACPRGY